MHIQRGLRRQKPILIPLPWTPRELDPPLAASFIETKILDWVGLLMHHKTVPQRIKGNTNQENLERPNVKKNNIDLVLLSDHPRVRLHY